MLGRSLGIAVLLICLPAFGQRREPVDASICSIGAHPSKFNNKRVRVRGRAISAISHGGIKVSTLIGFKRGNLRQVCGLTTCEPICGQIDMRFDSAGSDESTTRFLQLFGEQIKITQPNCNSDEQLIQGLRHALDPSIPAPPPCFAAPPCIYCPRYSIVATFTGKFRYPVESPISDFQLDVISVSDLDVLDVTDGTAHPKP